MTTLDKDKLKEKLDKARLKAETDKTELCAIRASYNPVSEKIEILFSNEAEFSFPAKLGEGLADASPEELAEVEVTPSGQALHWESLDADLSIPALLNGIFGTRQWMTEIGKKGGSSKSSAKTQASRQNGTKGGRPCKGKGGPSKRKNGQIAKAS
jgi:hypothetical protein